MMMFIILLWILYRQLFLRILQLTMFFHDTKDSIDEENEEVKEVTLEILYGQIKLYRIELCY